MNAPIWASDASPLIISLMAQEDCSLDIEVPAKSFCKISGQVEDMPKYYRQERAAPKKIV